MATTNRKRKKSFVDTHARDFNCSRDALVGKRNKQTQKRAMMTTMNNNSDESATLLRDDKENNATTRGGGRFKTYAMIGAAATLAAFGVLHAAQKSSSLTMGSGVRRARLGAGGPQTVTLHTGCSPLNKLPFDASGDWTGAIGAKVVSKSMSSDFRYEAALDMVETSCGNYEATVDLAVGEEFGFYLHPIGDDSDVNTALDNGCLHEGDARCPAFSSPSALAGIETCTSKHEDPGSGDVFYNRVFDGTTLSFNWGTCETTCAADGPPGCPATSTAPALPLDAATCPISSGTGDAGYKDNYRGWYDASGCGICQDYCRWVGNSGSGGDPSVKTSHHDSFWSCRKAGGKSFNPGTNQKDFCPDPSDTNIRNVGGCGTDNYSARGYYGDTFTLEKCSGQGAAAPGFSQTADNVAVAATGSKYWKVSNADPLGWRPKVKNFGLYSDAACTQLISEADSELICSGEVSSRPCSNAGTGKLPPLTPAERSIVNCDNSATSKGCRYSQENVGEEAVSWRPSDPSPSEDAVWIGSKFTNPVDVKCAVSTGLGNVFNNGVDGEGFGGTSQGGKHRITLWKSDDGVQWEEVATSDGTNADDVVVVQ